MAKTKYMKFKLNKIYEIEFKDHCVGPGSDKPVKIFAYGKVIEDNEEFVMLSSWMPINASNIEINANMEKCIIIKSCIINWCKL